MESDPRTAATTTPVSDRERQLTWLLRLFGVVDCLSLVAVLMPREMMHVIALRCGFEGFPPGALSAYLARSASLMYALHGATLLYVSRDVRLYGPLIRFLSMLAVAHGGAMLLLDTLIGMPLWWRLLEGPGFAMTGLGVLWLQRRT